MSIDTTTLPPLWEAILAASSLLVISGLCLRMQRWLVRWHPPVATDGYRPLADRFGGGLLLGLVVGAMGGGAVVRWWVIGASWWTVGFGLATLGVGLQCLLLVRAVLRACPPRRPSWEVRR